MEISQHIKNLLKSNDSIILGGFGTFTTKQISAKFDAETKTMRPPLKLVTFNPDIKEDSGVLAKFMSEQEGVPIENCREQINEYVKTVKTKLAEGKPVEFKDLGSFKQKEDGELKFSFLSDDNLLLDSFGLPVVSLSGKSLSSDIPLKETKKVIPITSKPAKKIEEKNIVKKDNKKQERLKEKEEKRKQRLLAQKQKRLDKQNKKKTDSKEKKKRGILPFLLTFLGVIAILLAALYFFKPSLWNKGYSYSSSKISQLFGGKDSGEYDIIEPGVNDEITDENINGKEDGINNGDSDDVYTDEDDILSDEEIEEGASGDNVEDETYSNEDGVAESDTESNILEDPVVKNETDVSDNNANSSAQSGKYYIIIASVQSESSAKKEVQRFAAKGISTEYIYVASKGRYRISAGEFSSAKAAQDFYSEMQTKHGNIDAWVWEKR